jgi:hypothetical protein
LEGNTTMAGNFTPEEIAKREQAAAEAKAADEAAKLAQVTELKANAVTETTGDDQYTVASNSASESPEDFLVRCGVRIEEAGDGPYGKYFQGIAVDGDHEEIIRVKTVVPKYIPASRAMPLLDKAWDGETGRVYFMYQEVHQHHLCLLVPVNGRQAVVYVARGGSDEGKIVGTAFLRAREGDADKRSENLDEVAKFLGLEVGDSPDFRPRLIPLKKKMGPVRTTITTHHGNPVSPATVLTAVKPRQALAKPADVAPALVVTTEPVAIKPNGVDKGIPNGGVTVDLGEGGERVLDLLGTYAEFRKEMSSYSGQYVAIGSETARSGKVTVMLVRGGGGSFINLGEKPFHL